MKIAITTDGPWGVDVWAMLDDDDFNGTPADRGESFVIGSGSNLSAAIMAAREELDQALEQLARLEAAGVQS